MKAKSKKAVLILEDGTIYYGKCSGKEGTGLGEICFNTGMTGYQEVFTDPSYFGQVVVTTNVHIGNYGYKSSEKESGSMKISGLICKDFNLNNSRYASDGNIKEYFEKENVIVISDIDTRSLVSYIRDKGVMNVLISSEIDDIEFLKKKLTQVPSMKGLELSSFVTTKNIYEIGKKSSKYKIAVLDLGVKSNIIRCLEKVGFYIKVFPMSSKLEDIMNWNPGGIFLSNGPGDPASMLTTIEKVKKMIDSSIPIFGICLGHQIIALASGLETYKMHNGHRGINHPVINLETKKCEVTSQNHGFSIKESSIEKNKNIVITHRNLNDNTIEGLKFTNRPCFSVQFHPESSPGPHDSRYLFDNFLNNVKTYLNNG